MESILTISIRMLRLKHGVIKQLLCDRSFTERKLKMLQHVHVRVEDIKNELNAAISFVEKSNAAAPKLLTHVRNTI